MARPVGVPTRQLGARVPCDLFEAAVRLGEKQGLDISSTIIQALQEWVDAQEENYCPVCSTVNPPAARYCMECASPLTPEGVEEFQNARRINYQIINAVFFPFYCINQFFFIFCLTILWHVCVPWGAT